MLQQSKDRVVPATGRAGGKDELSSSAFDTLRSIIYDASGIQLNNAKKQMVQARLVVRVRALNLATLDDYVKYVTQNTAELPELVNRITTNKTYFFREPRHFRCLMDTVLPDAIANPAMPGTHTIYGWCAASSTGEEPHTLATVLAHFLTEHHGWKARLLASDLDTQVLETARTGRYPMSALNEIPPNLGRGYTVPTPDGTSFGFKPDVTRLLSFRQINLMDSKYPIRSKLDFVFCRNVFIYFSREDRDNVVHRFVSLLKPGGYLFLGHSEVLDMTHFRHELKFVGNTTYQKLA